MGIEAQYYAISKEMINLYHSNDIDKFYNELDKLKETIYHCDLVKSWDILHYLCTGFTSYAYHQPVKKTGFLDKLKSTFIHLPNDNCTEIFATDKQKYLYYAFYGKDVSVTDEPSFNDYEDIIKIIEFLKEIDIEKIIKNIDCHQIPFDHLYPKLSIDDFNDDELIDNWVEHFENFKQFYQNVLENNRSVFINIC